MLLFIVFVNLFILTINWSIKKYKDKLIIKHKLLCQVYSMFKKLAKTFDDFVQGTPTRTLVHRS